MKTFRNFFLESWRNLELEIPTFKTPEKHGFSEF